MSDGQAPSQGAILRFWAPLAATWLMMAAEGPFVAALIARTTDPAVNLAAFGVAMAVAFVVEAPVVMLMSASTALVRDRGSLRAVRRFTYALCAVQTAPMALAAVPPVFGLLGDAVLALPGEVARASHLAVAALLPWPAAIGYRRFYQGILIRHGLTRRVAYGTVVRLVSMALAGVVLHLSGAVPGAVVGAGALSAGVVMEALASRLMVRQTLRAIHRGPVGEGIPLATLLRFYLPLALTTLMAFGITPLLTFFAARGRLPLESLAVLPVLNSLLFLFRAPGIAFQEVSVALLGNGEEARPALQRFGRSLALALTALLTVLAFTPLASFWYGRVAGLSPALAALAVPPLRLLLPLPALEVALAFARGTLIYRRRTREVSLASAVELGVVTATLALAVGPLGAVGVAAAAWALLLGRLVAATMLWRWAAAPARGWRLPDAMG